MVGFAFLGAGMYLILEAWCPSLFLRRSSRKAAPAEVKASAASFARDDSQQLDSVALNVGANHPASEIVEGTPDDEAGAGMACPENRKGRGRKKKGYARQVNEVELSLD